MSKGTYVSMKPNNKSLQSLEIFLEGILDTTGQDLHVTIMYSLDELKSKREPILYQRETTSYISWFEYWEGSGDGFLVAILDDEDLKDHHQYWKALGLTSTYEDYKPHMTLKTPIKEVEGLSLAKELNQSLKNVGLIELTFGNETIAPIE